MIGERMAKAERHDRGESEKGDVRADVNPQAIEQYTLVNLLTLAQEVGVMEGATLRPPTPTEVTERATAYKKWMADNG